MPDQRHSSGAEPGKHTRYALLEGSPGDPWRASSPPIYQTATFEQESPEGFGRYDYARSGNPTRETLERHVARLEGAVGCVALASGVAAITAVTRLLVPGDRLVAHLDLYGGTQRLLSCLAGERGIDVVHADLVDGDLDALSPGTRLVLVESLTNPLWRAPDLRAIAARCRAIGALLAVDATAMSPWLQRPLSFGADCVLHSATKLLSGHGDVTAGVISSASEDLHRRLAFLQNAEGSGLAPFDSWLLLRGMRTLGVRVDRQQESATRIAAWLARRPDVRAVHQPSLPSHPDVLRHAAQAEGPGVVVSFETGDEERSLEIVRRLQRFAIAVSFGSVDSTASLPCRMSHASVPPELRALRALPGDLIRLSIGLEDPADLMADLAQALAAPSLRASPSPAPEGRRGRWTPVSM
ncbi:MAG: PLP-dependent transferase [Phycisphaerae bacterium]|nr:PLP-dependent transferase [Phycisphaerae bacterium]